MTTKDVGAKCPACADHPCAEYVQMGGQPQWRCGKCGNGGALNGKISLAHAEKAPPAPPPPRVAPKGLLRYTAIAFLAVAATFAMMPLNAATYQGNGFSLELTKEECTSANAFLLLMMNGVQGIPKRATVKVTGMAGLLEACYAELDDEHFLLIDDNGGGGTLKRTAIKEVRRRYL